MAKAPKKSASKHDPRCDDLLLDRQLCFAVYTASRLIVQAYDPYLEPLGLTYPQYLVMLVLWERDGLTVSELGERLYLDSGTLSPVLKKLEQRGLVARERQADDERRVRIRLSSKGAALRAEALVVPEGMTCVVGMTHPQIVDLKDKLDELSAQVRQNGAVSPSAKPRKR